MEINKNDRVLPADERQVRQDAFVAAALSLAVGTMSAAALIPIKGTAMLAAYGERGSLLGLLKAYKPGDAAQAAPASPASAPEASELAGWKLVPIEPTAEMIKAAASLFGAPHMIHLVKAAIAAAPLPPVVERKDAAGQDGAA